MTLGAAALAVLKTLVLGDNLLVGTLRARGRVFGWVYCQWPYQGLVHDQAAHQLVNEMAQLHAMNAPIVVIVVSNHISKEPLSS